MLRSLSDGERDTAEILSFISGDEIVHVYYAEGIDDRLCVEGITDPERREIKELVLNRK